MKRKKKLLFVCTGNTCRSPMAKVLAEAVFSEAGLVGWSVDSAGVSALHGMSASSHAITVTNALGLDLSAHQSKPLTPELAANATIVLVMTHAHKQNLLRAMPDLAHKVYTLKEFAGASGDVSDPFGGSVALYLEIAQEIAVHLREITKKLPENA